MLTGGLKMISIRAKLNTIMLRNFMYIIKNISRPQYQISIYWLKFYLRDFLDNFNIIPCGLEKNRPIFFRKMVESIDSFKTLYGKWSKIENERRNKVCEQKNLTRKKKLTFKPVEKNFQKNVKLLTSKFIYNQYLTEFRNIPKLSFAYNANEEKEIFYNLHNNITCANIRIVNYKTMLKGLPLNKKFRNRYDKKCYICNKVLDEDLMHLFVSCESARKSFDFIKQYLTNNELEAHLDLIQYKFNLEMNDYKVISIYVYALWQTRNILKHSKELTDAFNIFRNIFNKWYLSKTSI